MFSYLCIKRGIKMSKKNKLKKSILFGHPLFSQKWSFGQKAADKLTKFAGSWGFILLLLILIGIWIYLNISAFIYHWDPWPFIILNLCLSCLAALQAPVILMSQNRQSQKDRLRTEYDYKVDRKTEERVINIQRQLKEIKKMIKDKNL
jgi:uncharacterized membrane protein